MTQELKSKLIKITDEISYLDASEDPISSNVVFIKPKNSQTTWIFDVGLTSLAAQEINAVQGKKIVVISHFHPDHLFNINRISYDELYLSAHTFKYAKKGTVVKNMEFSVENSRLSENCSVQAADSRLSEDCSVQAADLRLSEDCSLQVENFKSTETQLAQVGGATASFAKSSANFLEQTTSVAENQSANRMAQVENSCLSENCSAQSADLRLSEDCSLQVENFKSTENQLAQEGGATASFAKLSANFLEQTASAAENQPANRMAQVENSCLSENCSAQSADSRLSEDCSVQAADLRLSEDCSLQVENFKSTETQLAQVGGATASFAKSSANFLEQTTSVAENQSANRMAQVENSCLSENCSAQSADLRLSEDCSVQSADLHLSEDCSLQVENFKSTENQLAQEGGATASSAKSSANFLEQTASVAENHQTDAFLNEVQNQSAETPQKTQNFKIKIMELPSSHAKGSLMLQYGDYVFTGDGTYCTSKNGEHVYNANLLFDEIQTLEKLDCKYLCLSHDKNFVQKKESVLTLHKNIYSRRKSNEAYISVEDFFDSKGNVIK